MADLSDQISKIETALKKQGFKRDSSGIDKDFDWKPHILVTKNNESQAFLVRQTDSVPTSLIERLASTRTKKRKFYINIAFLTKPAPKAVKDLVLRGLGIQQLDRNTLSKIATSKNFSTIKAVKKLVPTHKKMMKTDIFISSHQTICERKTACDVIKNIHNTDRFPVYAFLVEDETGFGASRTETKKCINKGLKNCDWFVGILAEVWRWWVDYEVKRAISKRFKHKDITIYVKTTKKTKESWDKLLKWIEKRNIKHLPYCNTEDLKSKLSHCILAKIETLHHHLRAPMYN